MIQLPEYILDLIGKIAKSEGFNDYSIEIKAGSNHGDNFTSKIASVRIGGDRKINDISQTDDLHLICKIARAECIADVIFARESYMYGRVLPIFAEFQQEKGLSAEDSFNAYGRFFTGVSDVEKDQFVVIMEDVRPAGFTMRPKSKPSTLEHCQLMLQQLGRFHGISLALKDQRPDVFKQFEILDDLFVKYYDTETVLPVLHNALDMAIEALDNEEHVNILKDVKKNSIDYFKEVTDWKVFGPFGVIGHGDCWTNNLLYRNSLGNDTPTDIRFVDWQLSFYCSPAIDLLHFIFSATDEKLRGKEYEKLLRFYHYSLSQIVTKLGSDPAKLFSFEDLKQQLRNCGKYAFLQAPLLIKIMFFDSKDVPKSDGICEKENVIPSPKNDAYSKRIQGAIADLVGLGLYWN